MSKVFLHHTSASTTVFTDGTRKNLGIFICQFGMPSCEYSFRIFEPRYIDMIDDAMKSNKFIGMVQPKTAANYGKSPELYKIGCMGKITSFSETNDGRYLIELKGLLRFEIIDEINTTKKYRECKVDFTTFKDDIDELRIEGHTSSKWQKALSNDEAYIKNMGL